MIFLKYGRILDTNTLPGRNIGVKGVVGSEAALTKPPRLANIFSVEIYVRFVNSLTAIRSEP